MKKTIKHQLFFPHPQVDVWDYLTKPELMEQWLMKNTFQPKVGIDFQFKTNPIHALDFDGIVYCKVLKIEPSAALSYLWESGPSYDKITLVSVVEWKLESKDNGTALYLEHTGFVEGENVALYNGLLNGWLANIQKMAKLLNETKDRNANALFILD